MVPSECEFAAYIYLDVSENLLCCVTAKTVTCKLAETRTESDDAAKALWLHLKK